MSNLTDRVSYLMGLAEGLNLNDSTTEGKVLVKVLELLSELADEMDALRRDHDELDEYVESIDSDLSDMEEAIFGDDDDEEEGCGGCCSCHCGDDDDDEDDDDQLVEYACPHCGNEVTFEIDGFDFEEENLCPACGKPLFPDDEEEDEE